MAQSQPRLDAPECRPRLHVLGSFELRVPSDTNRENGRENGTGSTITSATSSVIAATAITSAIASPDERRLLALLALSDSGQPSFDADHAAALAEIGVPSFACTPDLFPDLMAAAIEKRDIGEWAAANDVVTTHETTKPV